MSEDLLGSSSKRHDGQMPPSLIEANAKNNGILEGSLPAPPFTVDLIGSAAMQPGVRAMPGIPFEEDRKLSVDSVSLKRDDDPARTLVFHGQNQPLDQTDAPMLS